MQNMKNNFINCFNLSINDNIVNFAKNIYNDEIIDVLCYPNYSLFYTRFNETHYRWCGPWLLILGYFAKFTRTKYNYLFEFNFR